MADSTEGILNKLNLMVSRVVYSKLNTFHSNQFCMVDSYDVMFEDGVVISADVTTLKLGDVSL